jgi:hypothetical protein
MGRPRTQDGRRVTLSVKVSEATAADLDAARGTLSRSSALEEALMLWLEDAGRPQRRPWPPPDHPQRGGPVQVRFSGGQRQ